MKNLVDPLRFPGWLAGYVLLLLISIIVPVNSQAKDTQLCSPQVIAHPIKGGYTWTLASRLGKFLEMAESEYGERDKSWTILGVEFTDEKQPSNWYPFDSTEKDIIIQLTSDAANNEKKALFQLSHEVIHVLSPNGTRKATYFEEGLATYFSIQATRQAGIDISPSYITSAKYHRAYYLLEKIYQLHPDASQRIATFRKSGQSLSTLSATGLRQLFPRIDATTARELARRFHE